MIRQFRDPKLVVATHNFGKLEEIRDLLLPYAVAVTGAAELNLPEPEETETSFVGNARIKAHAAALATQLHGSTRILDTGVQWGVVNSDSD